MSGRAKDVKGKERLNLIPYAAEVAIARVREFGNKKYKSPSLWYTEAPVPEEYWVEAARRHLGKYGDAKILGNRSLIDSDSGLPHLDHALTSLAMAVALRDKGEEK